METSWHSSCDQKKKKKRFDSISCKPLREGGHHSSNIWISMHVCIYTNVAEYTLEVLILFPLIHTELETVSVCHGNAILMKCFGFLIEMSHALVVTTWLCFQSTAATDSCVRKRGNVSCFMSVWAVNRTKGLSVIQT